MEHWTPVKYKVISFLIASFLFFPSACSSVPSALPIVTSTQTSSATLSPIDTQQPTETIAPSVTPLPTATTTPLVPELGQVLFSENFEDINFQFANIYGPGRSESGVLIMERGKNYPSPPGMWPTGGIYGINPISLDITILILFKSSRENVFHIGYHNNKYESSSDLRAFAFNSGFATWQLHTGNSPDKLWHTHQPRPDVWHYFSITRTASGDIYARIWERDNPEAKIEFDENVGTEWGELDLTFYIDFRGGTLMVDEYQELR